jgi:hypothetical protein
MAHKYLKHAGLAALLLGCSVGLAQAQVPTPPPLPGQIHRGAAATGIGGSGTVPKTAAACATGWNIFYCTSSYTTWDGTNSAVTAFNTDGSSFTWTSGGDLLATNGEALINACNTGHLYWIFITGTSCSWNGTFNSH